MVVVCVHLCELLHAERAQMDDGVSKLLVLPLLNMVSSSKIAVPLQPWRACAWMLQPCKAWIQAITKWICSYLACMAHGVFACLLSLLGTRLVTFSFPSRVTTQWEVQGDSVGSELSLPVSTARVATARNSSSDMDWAQSGAAWEMEASSVAGVTKPSLVKSRDTFLHPVWALTVRMIRQLGSGPQEQHVMSCGSTMLSSWAV